MSKTDKSLKIENTYKELAKLYESVDENKKALLDPMLHNFAFMTVELDEMQNIICKDGMFVIVHTASTTKVRCSDESQVYLQVIKTYNVLLRDLLKELPNNAQGKFKTFLEEFA